ncbi:Pathogenesis-related thaumatin superfamily protein [Striga hermonthica]|uniref:Pathogenesis-related thaumatin superfamily protein n=1 Tax=Striga hermonthica TaxID=68872 RepID=A0A9N7NJW6_STRHE|nr:Pathogenesis-related thaumatin superfamily protein [Striga hermonthica]
MEIQGFTSVIVTLCLLHATSNVHSAVFTIKNNCPYTIWPATLTGSGSQSQTGFELPSQATKSLDIASPWSGRFWARFECSYGDKFTCLSADCGSGQVECSQAGAAPPASLVEFTLGGDGGKDFYDISLVDGYNLPVSVSGANCPTVACPVDISNNGCPDELAVRDPSGGAIGCKSACLAFNQPQYCCTGDYGTPDKCPPTFYSMIFKSMCPQAYSYAYDDKTSTFTCPTGGDYLITFCP